MVTCATAIQYPAQWTSNSNTNNKALVFLRPFPYSGRVTSRQSEEKAAATQTNKAADHTSCLSQTACLKEWRGLHKLNLIPNKSKICQICL